MSKNKLTLSAAIIIGFVAFSKAQSIQLKDIKDNTVNYGSVVKGQDKERIIKVKNTGKKPLIISNAVGSCGCTVPDWPKTPILPGKVADLKITYDTNRVGHIDKTVTITSNDIKNPTLVLKVTGDVKEN